MMTTSRKHYLCAFILLLIDTMGSVESLNDTELKQMTEKELFLTNQNEDVEILNEGMECWSHCHNHQGPCPSWCGSYGMCCTKNPYWKDKSKGCDGTFGGSWRHECVYSDAILCLNDKESPCSFDNESSCEQSSILVNISSLEGDHYLNHEIWCPYISDDCYYRWESTFGFWFGVIKTVIVIIGILMNILFCFILSRKQLRNVFNSLLIALAIFDTLFLILESTEKDYLSVSWNSGVLSQIQILLFPKLLYPLRRIVFFSSMYMTVAISLERYIAVTCPISLHLQLKNDKKAQIIRFLKYFVTVFVASIVVTIPNFFESEAIYNNTTQLLELEFTIYTHTPENSRVFVDMVALIATSVLPFATIMYLNARTYRVIFLRRKKQNVITENTQNLSDSRNSCQNLRRHMVSDEGIQTAEEKLYIIFLFISILFLICHLPRFVLDFDMIINNKKFSQCAKAGFTIYYHSQIWDYSMSHIDSFLVIINSSLNSAIYCLYSSRYRAQMKQSLACFRMF